MKHFRDGLAHQRSENTQPEASSSIHDDTSVRERKLNSRSPRVLKREKRIARKVIHLRGQRVDDDDEDDESTHRTRLMVCSP